MCDEAPTPNRRPTDPGGRKQDKSAALQWRAIAGFVDGEARFGAAAARRGPAWAAGYEFLRFGIKQGWACLFGGLVLALLVLTRLFWPTHCPIARYDALFVAALAIQAALLTLRMETWREAQVICVFHLVGTIMEIHKTAIGSWVYPEANILRVGGVPLFTGFMYASVGSYIARAWRLFDFRFSRHPALRWMTALSIAIYGNFLTNHLGYDLRMGLMAAAIVLIGPTTVYFKIWHRHRQMPMLLGLVLVTLFIWFAENIGTFTGAWLYPNQMAHWAPVSATKLTSWFLLMIVSYTLVARAHGIVPWRHEDAEAIQGVVT